MSEQTTSDVLPATLVEAILMVQGNLPPINKNKTAKVPTKGGGEYSYKYADLADITKSVHPIIGRYGLTFLSKPTLNADRDFVLAYKLKHVSGEEETGEYPLPDPSSVPPQTIGSHISYARRYSLLRARYRARRRR